MLLRHRDIRTVDLPPRWGLDIRLLQLDLREFPPVPDAPQGAPGIAVLLVIHLVASL